jgi:hypothetical protein
MKESCAATLVSLRWSVFSLRLYRLLVSGLLGVVSERDSILRLWVVLVLELASRQEAEQEPEQLEEGGQKGGQEERQEERQEGWQEEWQ